MISGGDIGALIVLTLVLWQLLRKKQKRVITSGKKGFAVAISIIILWRLGHFFYMLTPSGVAAAKTAWDAKYGMPPMKIEQPQPAPQYRTASRAGLHSEALDYVPQWTRTPSQGTTARGAEYYEKLALAYFQQGRFADAILTFQEGLKLPCDAALAANLWEEIGSCYVSLDRWADAEDAYRHSVAINPTEPRVWDLLYLLCDRTGQKEKAAAAFKKFQALTSRWLTRGMSASIGTCALAPLMPGTMDSW
jgi:tetratricopeptide (TPR) repeat protein